mmetsp:Transcript_9562/g.11818  ORF Transcript_9562/g.11818 Transcript_9562/m.11818 type:complete len:213 (-) Transcript_9562:1181-1819(-)
MLFKKVINTKKKLTTLWLVVDQTTLARRVDQWFGGWFFRRVKYECLRFGVQCLDLIPLTDTVIVTGGRSSLACSLASKFLAKAEADSEKLVPDLNWHRGFCREILQLTRFFGRILILPCLFLSYDVFFSLCVRFFFTYLDFFDFLQLEPSSSSQRSSILSIFFATDKEGKRNFSGKLGLSSNIQYSNIKDKTASGNSRSAPRVTISSFITST